MFRGLKNALGITSDRDEKLMRDANRLTREQMSRLQAIDLPDYEKMRLALQVPELVGLLDAEELGRSEFEEIQDDPRLRSAQLDALAQLQEIGEVGLTPEERAQRSELMRDSAAQNQAAQEAILQSMAQRGTLDSGSALIAQLQSAADQTEDARRQSEQLASDIASRRRDAIMRAGGMAGDMSNVDFSRQAQAAQAADRIAQFNAQQRMDVNRMNLAQRQALENQRAATANQQQQFNRGLERQRFQDEMAKVTGVNQASQNMANMKSQQAANVAAGNQATMGSLFGLGGAAIGNWGSLMGRDKD